MAKKSTIHMMAPPRYARHDPRNLLRVAAGRLLSMQLGGYDYPIRKLRRHGDMCVVTLPPQVRKLLDIKLGDWVMFGKCPWRGMVWLHKLGWQECEGLPEDRAAEWRWGVRKVQGKKWNLFVTVSRGVREALSAEVGDALVFSLPVANGVISVCTVKGGGDGKHR